MKGSEQTSHTGSTIHRPWHHSIAICVALAASTTIAIAQANRDTGRGDRPTRQINSRDGAKLTNNQRQPRSPIDQLDTGTMPTSPNQPARRRRAPDPDAPDRDRDERRERTPGELALPLSFPSSVRTIDGTENNPLHPSWGRSNISFLRQATAGYGDGLETPAGSTRASAGM